ncbi:MAG: dNTP triphosphohydrolase [Pirellulales bacterium]|nr:dNTP triphosphohydrolase [Pirellulales bacterium]
MGQLSQSSESASTPDWLLAREAALLAPYAMASAHSRGRVHPEPPHLYRGPFQRDRDRILHCAAFRRLAQKTQVFTGHGLGDYHRTRLTHTLEGTSIARTIGRVLRLNEDLIEALMLLHDIGHPPFGHAGEDALDDCLAGQGGFDHNAQALRIVTLLAQRTPRYPGLNLSQEVLAGQARRVKNSVANPLAGQSGLLARIATVEADVVDAADSIAYDSHDPDDALHYGLISLAELNEVPLWALAARQVRARHANLDNRELRQAVVHELINLQVVDLIQTSQARLGGADVTATDAATSGSGVIGMSSELTELCLGLERFLYERVYRHPQLLSARSQFEAQLRTLFAVYLAEPELLPPKFQIWAGTFGLPRAIGDYIAGMTDRFALAEHGRLSGG